MNTTNTAEQTKPLINGVNVDQLMNVIGEIEADQNYAKFQFRATNQWINGSLSRSRIKGFYAGNAEDSTRDDAFTLDADEPFIAAGQDSAPNSMEYVLHALATCLTGTLVYHASVNGIVIDSVESSYAGDMDVRGLFGLADDVRKGFNKVTVEMRVKSKASVDELTALALFSPVYDIISKSLPVEFKLTTY
ncbi:MAG: OsmC family peroxiredoxin [Gammaproteobacteria bacterium]|nr:MAG: OsmC family peroxiredoxin [Gammaproteobacteria bacterium]